MIEINKESIKKAFKGINRKQLAKSLKTSRAVIDLIATGYSKVSPRRALQIERLTGGKVRAKILRPDIFSSKE